MYDVHFACVDVRALPAPCSDGSNSAAAEGRLYNELCLRDMHVSALHLASYVCLCGRGDNPLSKAATSVWCRDPACEGNHIKYTKDKDGFMAALVLPHFKNESIKGVQEVPLSPKWLRLVALLERAAAAHRPSTGTLFCATDGTLYKEAYFSTVSTTALSFNQQKCTSRHFRHLFTTNYKAFTTDPGTTLRGISAHVVQQAAADLMLTSTQMLDSTYDDSAREKGTAAVMSLWPKFKEYVKEQHLKKRSEE